VSDLRRKHRQQHQCTVAEMLLQMSCPRAERRVRIVAHKGWRASASTRDDRRVTLSCSCSHDRHRCVPSYTSRSCQHCHTAIRGPSLVEPRCAPAEPLPTEVRRTETSQENFNRGGAAQRR
jgi:hypothetical protein